MSLRIDQVESVLRRAVQTVIGRGLHDPRIKGLISVTAVKVSPDMAQAVISISVHPAGGGELAMHGIRHAAGHIRTLVGREVRMRRVPRLEFRLDDSLKRQADVLAAIAGNEVEDGVADSIETDSNDVEETDA